MTDHPDKTAEQAPMSEQADRVGGDGVPDWRRDINLIRATLDQAEIATRSHLVPSQVTHALHRIEEALIAAGEGAEPVAYRYQLAHSKEWQSGEPGEYCDWHWHVSLCEPHVPEGSIRNLTPLYAAPPHALREAIARALFDHWKATNRTYDWIEYKKWYQDHWGGFADAVLALSSAPVPSGEGSDVVVGLSRDPS